jgi:hypothetical protein
VTQAPLMTEFAMAITVGLLAVRYWRQLVAAVVAAIVTLSVIGLVTVMSWLQHWPHP